MIRFVFRLLSLWSLVVAVAAAVMDSIETVAASGLVMTSLGSAWAEISPSSLFAAEELLRDKLPPFLSVPFREWLLPQPAFGVFLILALLFWMIGYRKPNPAGRFAA
ncbi:hypothetical protein [Rhizobium halophytocola]|uniref:Uncharacterized protein n=1 Tax=Rhizobium halophytocola TaxID=735519 RepID=A0ABS4E1C5_9HYPH|nr:hypothetical protein [Rhizobium halophytocola]MBP1851731.1 hypothetical protein [Rhizobium halophytocola]